ncbi:ABC transporter substrate-binding protein [Paenibacillus glucanolyticus]|jgi:putative aldouronate transport system substrate-binding protein|uniref:extracellular solute-binding protein n=1 Tax=Paenibacillus TaxID=44249 RepID=UPI0003E24ED2|nr:MULTISPECIES: extracellular solute-binding protein [Paenibacillus]ANA81547.1 ABC transporter substrate-binding protein [Paenibacillus glucanolyticus]AVV59722.1 ABC transporter substrate-binding protein [Paenibacillus glucanolyticus]ETT30419.1 family 1 extracellular solute-binding protein [Paenibacillus sp. FSL R5-808]MPY19477.1 extracellular solute-binding protein [Paenibacillus glucanolyticus]
MKKKKASSILAIVTALSVLAGCGGGSSAPAATGTSNGSAAQGENKSEPVAISIMANLHTPEVPSDMIEKLLEEKTGTKLEIQWVPDGTYDEKVNASFATGTLPQVTYLKNAASLVNMRDAIRNGQFWEIGPLLDQYPNLSRLKPEVLKNTAVDGKIYALYREVPLSRQGIIYRKDWADKLGLSAPTHIDEFYNMLKQFKENDPDGNGKDDTIPLTDRNDLVYGAFKTISSWLGTPNNWGEKDGKLAPEFMFPEYMETMNFFKKLHQEGLINQDFPVTSKTDQQNLFITGKSGVYIGAMGDVSSLHPKVVEVNPDAELDVQNKIEGGPNGYGIWSVPGYGSVILFPKTAIKTEEDLNNVLTFMDQLMSPELGNLIYWGVEGTHHKLEDGKVIPSEDTKLTDREVKPYQAIQVGGPLTIEGFYEPKHMLPVKAKSEEMITENNDYLIEDPSAALDSKTFNEKGVQLQEMIKDGTYRYMLGDIDEAGFQSVVDNWLKSGGQQIIDEFNVSYSSSK